MRVTAEYLHSVDGILAATQWLVYLKSGAGNPIPGVDSPTVVTMTVADGLARLDITSSTTWANGTRVAVLVRVRRDTVDSQNTAAAETTTDTSGPTNPDGSGVRIQGSAALGAGSPISGF